MQNVIMMATLASPYIAQALHDANVGITGAEGLIGFHINNSLTETSPLYSGMIALSLIQRLP